MDDRKLRKAQVFTTGEAAKVCRVAPRTMSKWVDAGKMAGAYRLPGSQDRRIPRAALVRFMREHNFPIPGGLRDGGLLLVCSPRDALATLLAAALAADGGWELTHCRDLWSAGHEASGRRPDAVLFDMAAGPGECRRAAEVLAGWADAPALYALAAEDGEPPGPPFVKSWPATADPAEVAAAVRAAARHLAGT
jgi:excisionase family DNA binding protein